jgi:hypothetical protein
MEASSNCPNGTGGPCGSWPASLDSAAIGVTAGCAALFACSLISFACFRCAMLPRLGRVNSKLSDRFSSVAVCPQMNPCSASSAQADPGLRISSTIVAKTAAAASAPSSAYRTPSPLPQASQQHLEYEDHRGSRSICEEVAAVARSPCGESASSHSAASPRRKYAHTPDGDIVEISAPSPAVCSMAMSVRSARVSPAARGAHR